MSNPLNQLILQPSPLGEVFVSCRDITGPALYTTGGVQVSATAFALLTLKFLDTSMLTASGTYFVRAKLPRGGGFPTATLVWYTASSGAEVANNTVLSAEFARILAFGN